MAVAFCDCCRATGCCPHRPLPGDLCADVSSSCPAVNGRVRLVYRPPVAAGDDDCWIGRILVSGCFTCVVLEITVCCELLDGGGFQWTLSWALLQTDGTVCVLLTDEDTTSTVTFDCGPPLTIDYHAGTWVLLTDPDTGACCADFDVDIHVEECSAGETGTGQSPPPMAMRAMTQQDGVGTELKDLLAELGATASTGCKCQRLVDQMDREGPDWCWDARYMVAETLRDSIRRLSFGKKLKAAIRGAVRGVVVDPRDPAPDLFDLAFARYCERHPGYVKPG